MHRHDLVAAVAGLIVGGFGVVAFLHPLKEEPKRPTFDYSDCDYIAPSFKEGPTSYREAKLTPSGNWCFYTN